MSYCSLAFMNSSHAAQHAYHHDTGYVKIECVFSLPFLAKVVPGIFIRNSFQKCIFF